MAPTQTRARRGFTLVETALVIVVTGLLLGIAVPRFTAMRNGLRIDSAAHQLAGDLRRAQVEAIKRNRSIDLVKTGASTYDIQSVPTLIPLVPLVTVFYTRSFEPDVTFAAGAMTVRMASFGPPVGGGSTFTINHAGRTKTVTVGANGLVSVQ